MPEVATMECAVGNNGRNAEKVSYYMAGLTRSD